MSDHMSTFLQVDLQNLYVPRKSDREQEDYSDRFVTARKGRTREDLFKYNQYKQQNLEEKSTPKIDFDKLWDHFNRRETESLNTAKIYTIKNPETDSGRFETKLRQIGFDVFVRNLPKTKSKENRVTNSISITIDCVSSINLFDKLILMTNNGAYADLCKFVKSSGKVVELWCFKDNYDSILESYADKSLFYRP